MPSPDRLSCRREKKGRPPFGSLKKDDSLRPVQRKRRRAHGIEPPIYDFEMAGLMLTFRANPEHVQALDQGTLPKKLPRTRKPPPKSTKLPPKLPPKSPPKSSVSWQCSKAPWDGMTCRLLSASKTARPSASVTCSRRWKQILFVGLFPTSPIAECRGIVSAQQARPFWQLASRRAIRHEPISLRPSAQDPTTVLSRVLRSKFPRGRRVGISFAQYEVTALRISKSGGPATRGHRAKG